MSSPDLFTRIRQARLFQVLAVYLGVSWVVLQVTNELREALSLPHWVSPVAVILLLIGLVVVLMTAWVQAMLQRPGYTDAPTTEKNPDHELGVEHPLHGWTWSRALLGGVVAFGLLFGTSGAYVLWRNRFATPDVDAAPAPGIAVVPFSVTGPGLDVWREGMVDLLSTNLDGVGGLRAIDSRTVIARWREKVDSGRAVDLKTTLDVARSTGAKYALVGSAIGLGKDVRLSASVYDVASGKEIVSAQKQGSQDSVMSLIDRLSIDVVRAIAVGRADNPLAIGHLSSLTTTSLPALKAFLEGEAAFRPADFTHAIPAYERALAADSTFALALFRLATSYGWNENISSARTAEYNQRALHAVDRLPAREAVLVRGSDAMRRGALDAIPLLQDAVNRYTDDAEAWYLLGDAYFHLGDEALIDPAETVRALTRALAIDPGFTPAYPHLIDVDIALGDTTAAWVALREFEKRAPSSEYPRAYRNALTLAFGSPQARAQARRALDTIPTSYFVHGLSLIFKPRTARALYGMSRAWRARPDAGFLAGVGPVHAAYLQGRRADAIAALNYTKLGAGMRAVLLYRLRTLGAPLDPRRTPPTAPVPLDSLDVVGLMLDGADAMDQARTADVSRINQELIARAQKKLASGDSVSARRYSGASRALAGYVLARHGRSQEAIPALKQAQVSIVGSGPIRYANWVVRGWIGEAYAESGNLPEAIRYYSSIRHLDPLALLRLGDLYTQAGEREKARAAYAEFLDYWKDADADLPQPARAREALLKLGGDRPR
jgi:tetratricopeptide (TPR) repeat protein/TolB-like protein